MLAIPSNTKQKVTGMARKEEMRRFVSDSRNIEVSDLAFDVHRAECCSSSAFHDWTHLSCGKANVTVLLLQEIGAAVTAVRKHELSGFFVGFEGEFFGHESQSDIWLVSVPYY